MDISAEINKVKESIRNARNGNDLAHIKADIDRLKQISNDDPHIIEQLNILEKQVSTQEAELKNSEARILVEKIDQESKIEEERIQELVNSLEKESRDVSKSIDTHIDKVRERTKKQKEALNIIRNSNDLNREDFDKLGIAKSEAEHEQEKQEVRKMVAHLKSLDKHKEELVPRIGEIKPNSNNTKQAAREAVGTTSLYQAHVERIDAAKDIVVKRMHKVCDAYIEKARNDSELSILAHECGDNNAKGEILNDYVKNAKKQNQEIGDILSEVPELAQRVRAKQSIIDKAEEERKNLFDQEQKFGSKGNIDTGRSESLNLPSNFPQSPKISKSSQPSNPSESSNSLRVPKSSKTVNLPSRKGKGSRGDGDGHSM